MSDEDAPTSSADSPAIRQLTLNAATDAPQPPSSSTQGTSTAPTTINTEESERTEVSGAQSEKDFLTVAGEVPAVPKKNRGLLHVPSRSSSHKVQPSPTSTGLSGATASDPQESTRLRSKGSKGSFLGRRRNGSATSSRMSIPPPGAPAGAIKDANKTAINVSTSRQPKKSFLSILCCGVPDQENAADPNEAGVLANRVTRSPPGRATTAGRPDNVGFGQQNDAAAQPRTEKEALQQSEPGHDRHEATNLDPKRPLQPAVNAAAEANGELSRPLGVRDQPLPALPQEPGPSTSSVNPTTLVQVSVRTSSTRKASAAEPSGTQEYVEDGVRLENTDPLPSDKETIPDALPRRDDVAKPVLPPPPVPQAAPGEEAVPETSDAKQQWLLPPIAPRFKGKKCLVLDLDETLVHSSFKVRLVSARKLHS
jgi:carboxy-terminal domain RNA polymerase II polypeptide A small phosphatase